MTLHEFINSYKDCAINDVPSEAIESIVQSVPVSEGQQRFRGNFPKCAKTGLRFRNGVLDGYNTIGNYYKSFSLVKLEAIISYNELMAEEESDDDFTAVFDLC